MTKTLAKYFTIFTAFTLLSLAQSGDVLATEFNPNFIISDTEVQDLGNWTSADIQGFLQGKGSFLSNFTTADASGTPKKASDIIYEAAQNYQINPKFLLVTLQKEQSLITDDTPTQKQLDWAAGYAVCDSCSMDDPRIQKHKGFGKQVDDAAGVFRWYYDNKDNGVVKKIDVPITIDGQEVVPQSWATAFLYTYTPHLTGNKNFDRIWDTWFSQLYPDGTILMTASSSEIYLIQNGLRKKFKSMTVLVSRADPKLVVTVPDSELNNYQIGPELSFPNYSILKSEKATYLLDYEYIRPFASDEVVRKLGFNPEEIIDVRESDLTGYSVGSPITVSSAAPTGVIYQITDMKDKYYLYKDNLLYPILDKKVVQTNFKNLKIEKKKIKELGKYEVADLPIQFADGTLLKIDGTNKIYVMEKSKKRRIADDDTFVAMGYKKSNIISIPYSTAISLLEGEPIYLNSGLMSSKSKFLGDAQTEIEDLFGTKLPAYLVAEYPSGRIISGKDIDTRRPLASITKLMTAYEALEQDYDLKKTSAYDSKQHSSYNNPLGLITGEKMKNVDIFNAMLVGSVNNLARVVAKGTGTPEDSFVASMNEKLEEWGADSTNLVDVTGLDENNKSTPRDILKIFTKILTNATIKESLFQTDYTFKELVNKNKVATHKLTNTNQILLLKNRNFRIL
ncbi:MAG: hypothetical protein ABII98_02590, partial [bacterium]